jgi:hypothetical protein
MKRRTTRKQQMDKRRVQRKASMLKPGHKSQYAKKAAYCHAHGVWGFEVSNPKPWK